MPSKPAGRCSKTFLEEEEERWWEEGKIVESVPRGVRFRILRARIADS